MTEGYKLTATGSKSDGNNGRFKAENETDCKLCVKPHFNFIYSGTSKNCSTNVSPSYVSYFLFEFHIARLETDPVFFSFIVLGFVFVENRKFLRSR